MKLSRYNILQKDTENRYILYNTFYKSIIEMSALEASRYNTLNLDNRNNKSVDPLIEVLKELNFIVDDEFDELAFFRLLWYRSLYSSGIIRHTLFPNLACNLDCPYCFENKDSSFMSKETADEYLTWLEPQLLQAKYFFMNWFGGEPLLSKEIIRYISRKVLILQNKYNFEYGASIVTNGTLMDEAFIDEMPDLNIQSIQVTIDGTRDIHDKYRFFKGNNKGTYDDIISNLVLYAQKNQSEVASTIRINVTDDNYDMVEKLLDDFPDILRRSYMILFRWVYSHPQGRNPNVEYSSCHRGEAPFNNLAKLYQMAEDKGYTTNSFDEGNHYNFCECDFDNAIQVNQDGNLFMCSHCMDESEKVGNVRDGFGTQQNLARYARFITENPFEDKECLECNILPICKGGCRKARYLGKKVCSDVKYSVPQYILQKANRKYASKKGDII